MQALRVMRVLRLLQAARKNHKAPPPGPRFCTHRPAFVWPLSVDAHARVLSLSL
jgi:hypothetical protein